MSKIVETIPRTFSSNVVLNVVCKIRFDTELDPETISTDTVILAEDKSDLIIPGVAGYTFGTIDFPVKIGEETVEAKGTAKGTVTFKLFEILKKNTDYTLILVGGPGGIKTTTGQWAVSEDNFLLRFQTGEDIDPNLPLAKKSFYDGPSRPFRGADGIYTEVYNETGEPVQHIVTTQASVEPSGHIVPGDPEEYLPPPVEIEDLDVIKVDPGYGELI